MRCRLCGDQVASDNGRQHLMEHHPGAAHFTDREVGEFFVEGDEADG